MLQNVLTICLAAVLATSASLETSTALAQARKKPAAKKAAPKRKAPPKPRINLPMEAKRTEVKIAPVSASQRGRAQRSAAMIDAIVERGLSRAGQEPNLLVPDEAFVRRAYLDITGTIPTAREYRTFILSRSSSKRVELIDRLLDKAGYASHFYNYWADVLRIVDKVDNNTYLRPYGDWVKQSLRENKPFDTMVKEMITAEGKVWENPAVGFTLRDNGMALDNLNNMVRTFPGNSNRLCSVSRPPVRQVDSERVLPACSVCWWYGISHQRQAGHQGQRQTDHGRLARSEFAGVPQRAKHSAYESAGYLAERQASASISP